jgi:hypothetical protein
MTPSPVGPAGVPEAKQHATPYRAEDRGNGQLARPAVPHGQRTSRPERPLAEQSGTEGNEMEPCDSTVPFR